MAGRGYYIYAVIDPSQLASQPAGKRHSVEDLLGAAVYVGKGIGERLHAHVAEARDMVAQDLDGTLAPGSKLRVLADMLRAGNEPRAVKLAAPFSQEAEAYAVESFAIEAVNAIRRQLGRAPLTNAVAGHGVAVEAEEVYLDRLDVQNLPVKFTADRLSIFVKGTDQDMADEVSVPNPDLLDRYGFSEQDPVDVMERSEAGGERPGWRRHTPWPEDVARARGRRFWPIALDTVQEWISNPEKMPEYLYLGIPEAGRTVVRYVWEIDPQGRWELHPQDKGSVRWGIPLKPGLVEDHPFLNRVLVEATTGKQVLVNRTSGVRVDRFAVAES